MSFDTDQRGVMEPLHEISISVRNVGKVYHGYESPIDRLKQFVFPRMNRLSGRQSKDHFRVFKALQDINFEVARGEVVGIVGRNGSGKSTLLQIICGTLSATTGDVRTHGRISALLELGSGFNPEFTGRDNMYLNAALIGMPRGELEDRIPDILEFADIGDFIDQPVKTYSSGMAVRLAFAVAINVSADILIVDEALAVGDELFQRKCFSRIDQLRSEGATILFVSHSAGTIVDLCDRAVLLDGGELIADGPPKAVVGLYQKLLYAPVAAAAALRQNIKDRSLANAGDADRMKGLEATGNKSDEITGDDEVYDSSFVPMDTIVYESHGALISAPEIRTLAGARVNGLVRGRKYVFRYVVDFAANIDNVRFGMVIKALNGTHLGGSMSAPTFADGRRFQQGQKVVVEYQFDCMLNPGVFFLNAGVFGNVGGAESVIHRLADAAAFRVLPVSNNISQEWIDFSCRPMVEIHG
ncbi:MAG: ABC transporter ATP-binding protein [Stenotrophomonas sp.]